jgi:ATP-dependent protease ClpP protease subunit
MPQVYMKFVSWLLPLFMSGAFSFSLDRRQMINGAFGGASSFQMSASDSSRPEPFLRINNDANEGEQGMIQQTTDEIYFYGPMTQRTCFELKTMLKDMEMKMITLGHQYHVKTPPIHLHIQSQGGSLYHTLYIVDLIQSLNVPVHTYVDGFAASAATLISVVGEKRYMTKNSLMLIHQLSGSDSGKFNELQDQMSNMNVLMDIIVDTYKTHTKIQNMTLYNLLQKDLWLNSETCLKYGLVDEII